MQALQARSAPPAVPDVRVSTVTPSSIALLERLGLWPQLSSQAAHFSSMQVHPRRCCCFLSQNLAMQRA